MLFQIERQLRERLVFNMKKLLQAFLLLIIGCSCLTLTSCDTGNTLYVLNWAEYIDEDLIVMFEEEYNCTVVLDIAQSNEAMFSKIVSDAAPYDIAFPSDYMIDQMINCRDEGINESIIQKIDISKLSDDYNESYNYQFFEERFDIKNILDYQFEVIEVVPKSENILEREKYYIQKYYKENPEKSLNIMCVKGGE